MNQRYRIWIDQDSVIYDLGGVWYSAHNRDYPNHDLQPEHINGWNTQAVCDAVGCEANIYSYFDRIETWRDGSLVEGCKDVIDLWYLQNIADLGVLTTAANGMSMPYKLEWLNNNFPYIKSVVMVNTHLKHLIRGDILIDDGIHNLEKWQGISVLYSQPWNQDNTLLPRAKTWKDVDLMVRDAIELLDDNADYTHKQIQIVLRERYNV